MNTKNVTLSNNSFTGSIHVTSGSALEIVNSTALLNDCSFTRYLYGTYRWIVTIIPQGTSTVHRTKKWIGGALIVSHGNVTIVKGIFTENRAQMGGAIYAENGTRIIIIKSKFIYNAAKFSSYFTLEQTAAGGALYATNNCSIFVSDSHFDHNTVYDGYRLGGTMAVHQGMIQVVRSVLANSTADIGAAVYLSELQGVFNLTNFSSNRAAYDGGAVYSINSSLNLSHSVFFDNKAATKGGVLFLSQSRMDIQNCMFVRNSASGVNGDGGVIYAKIKSAWSANSC
jgi:predicted outer membrane repeat protein